MVSSTWLAVEPDGAMRSILAGSSTVRPRSSVNSTVSAVASAVVFCSASPPDDSPPDEQPVTANARPRHSVRAAMIASSLEASFFVVMLIPAPFLSVSMAGGASATGPGKPISVRRPTVRSL